MNYIAINRDGSSFSMPESFKKVSERNIITIFPFIKEIICVETQDVVWSRTMAYWDE